VGLLRMAARTTVIAGTATAVSGRVARRQAARYQQQEEAQQFEQQQQYGQQPQQYQQGPPPQAALAAPEDEMITKLKELGQLHNQGVLSDAEFSAAKTKLLGL
jgi:hemolysin activation/secretion protein